MSARAIIRLVMPVFIVALAASYATAMPPTKEAYQQWIADGTLDQKLQDWANFKAAGGCAPFEHSPLKTFRARHAAAQGPAAVDTIHVITILVEFTDWPASGQGAFIQPGDFDSLLFSDRRFDPVFNDNGSMTDFYWENSYGTVYIQGDIFGWYLMPQTYAHYVGSNSGLGSGGPELAGDAIDAAEAAGVDFSPYANGDSFVDGVIVIHAGPGAETGAYGIWSHRSSTSTRTYDGVQISAYTLNPEEYNGGISTMGVYSHEYGHILGLPDLYDINGSSPGAGLGVWSIMAGGSWNDQGRVPAHFDAWCKSQLGFVNVIWLDSNQANVQFPEVEHNPVVYGMNEIAGGSGPEYWLVENRQKTGFDAKLPFHGLLTYHVDNTVPAQNNRFRYKVALEQADGDDDLANNGSSDTGDPWPGSTNNRNFHDQSVPNSRDNDGGVTEVGVWNISNSDSLMTADLDVTFSRPWITFATADSIVFSDSVGGDGDGILEAGETIEFYGTLMNRMRSVYGGIMTLSVDNSDVQFVQNNVTLSADLTTNLAVTNFVPIQFTLPAGFESVISRFTLTIVADSVSGSGDGRFTKSFSFDQALGATQILVVDDDGGKNWDVRVTSTITDLRFPNDRLDYSIAPPTAGDLAGYKTVVWHTGSNLDGVTLTASDVAVMKSFLDGGGNLFLTSMTAASTLQTLDSAFMADYLHATLAGSGIFAVAAVGDSGSVFADGVKFQYDGNAPVNPSHDKIDPVGTAERSFHFGDDVGNGDFGTCGVSFTGSFRTVFMTFPAEFVNDGLAIIGFPPKDTLFSRVLGYFRTNYPFVQSFTVPGDDLSALVSHTPAFAWSGRDTIPFVQTQYELEIGTDNDWTTAEMWATGVTATADTFVTYAGSPLIDGTTYFMRLRVNNGTYWSDWFGSTLHMNSLPTPPSPLSPSGGKITGATPMLTVADGSDAESSSLSYQFEIYSDAGLTAVVTTSPDITETADSTSWTVDVTLNELTDYWWRARSFDGAEYGNWSAAEQFTVNSAYVPPTGSIRFAAQSFLPCDTECIIQPVEVSSSKPLVAAVIPVSIPGTVTICDINFDGLPTASWDMNSVLIAPDSGYALVTLANSFGDTLPAATSTAFNILFNPIVPCRTSNFIIWDTTRFDVPGEQLKFTDTFEVFSPDFVPGQDTTEIQGYEPGNVDSAPAIDIGDLTQMISYLFIGGQLSCNANAGDVTGDCVGPDIGDLTYLIGYLFLSGPDPLCGCVFPASAPPASRPVRSDVGVQTTVTYGVTTIELRTTEPLRGIQMRLKGDAAVLPENMQAGALNMLTDMNGDGLSVIMVDLDGAGVMPRGTSKLLRLKGTFDITTATVSDMHHSVWSAAINPVTNKAGLPSHFAVDQNYPNPFNPTTQIKFALPTSSRVRLEIYNALGQKVVTLVDAELEAGYHTVEWDSRTGSGSKVASGVYLYRLVADDFKQTKKMLLLK